MCEAAQTAKCHRDFAATYAALARRRGKKNVATAVARKLLTRAYHLLTAHAQAQPRAQSTAAKRRRARGATTFTH